MQKVSGPSGPLSVVFQEPSLFGFEKQQQKCVVLYLLEVEKQCLPDLCVCGPHV